MVCDEDGALEAELDFSVLLDSATAAKRYIQTLPGDEAVSFLFTCFIGVNLTVLAFSKRARAYWRGVFDGKYFFTGSFFWKCPLEGAILLLSIFFVAWLGSQIESLY